MDNNSVIMLNLLTILNQLKICHWQTLHYTHHTIIGELYDTLNDNIDKFIEVLTGKTILESGDKSYRITFGKNKFSLNNYIDGEELILMNGIINYFKNDMILELRNKYPELINIIDEIIMAINKATYLLSMN